MAISSRRAMRVVAVGLLTLALGVIGAMPAAAGPPGPGGSGKRSDPAGQHGGGREASGVSAKQAGGGSAPARTRQGAEPRPNRQRTAASRKVAPSAAAQSAAKAPGPAERKPDARAPDRQIDDGPQRPRPSPSPSPSPSKPRPKAEARSSTASPAARTDSRPDRPRQVRSTARPTAAVVASSADPTAALLAAPPVVHLQAAAVELEPRQLWPRLPGPAGHPAFPGLLGAVLVGFVVLGFRGDRRDPKLAEAAIDDRDDRAEFR